MSSLRRMVVVDIETQAPLDLKKVGVARYAQEAKLDVCAWEVLEQLPNSPDNWVTRARDRGLGKNAGDAWIEAIASLRKGDAMVAHNAMFERTLLHTLGHRVPSIDSWIDTQLIARHLNLPAGLGNLASYILHEDKDEAGHKIMRARVADALSGQGGIFADTDDLKRLGEYCAKDVELTGRLAVCLLPRVGGFHGKRIREETESHLWVNETGIPIDVALVDAMAAQATLYSRKWDVMIRKETSFEHDATQKAKLAKWLGEKGYKPASGEGKDLIAAVAGCKPDDEARKAVELCVAACSTSTRKWETMRQTHTNGYIRDHLTYCKQTTGRWAGKKAQLQNYPNPAVETDEAQADALKLGQTPLPSDWSPRRVATAIKTGMRRAIRAPAGMRLVKADYAQIELRALLWFCELDDDLALLHNGGDLYRNLAGDIYNKKPEDVDKRERTIGKMAVLAAGYGVGAAQLGRQLADAGVSDAESIAEVARDAYHSRWPGVKRLWASCHEAFETGSGKGRGWSARTVTALGRDALVFTLPSRRPIVLWEPGKREDKWGKMRNSAYAGDGLRWYPPHTLAQNITCGMARDVLSDAIMRIQTCCKLCGKDECLDAARVVGHVHDEIIVEVRSSWADEAAKAIASIMEEDVPWIQGLPLTAEASHSEDWFGG